MFGYKLRAALLCLGLELAMLMGAPVKPDEIENLLRDGARTRIEYVVRAEEDE